MRIAILIQLTLTAAFCGCAKSASREDEILLLRTILPEALLAYASLDVAAIESVAAVGDGPSRHLGLHLFPGQKKVHKGVRAEVSVDYPFEIGETVRYSWRFMLPKDFVSDAPKNRWWVIGQWHDQPNKQKGETWDGFPSHSPPVLIGLGEAEGGLKIGLSYGTPQLRDLGLLPVERGKWHSISVVISWSKGPDGKAAIFLDDLTKPAITAEGANMHNDYQHYFKLGMYRHPEISTENWIYIDDVQISKEAIR